MQETKISFIGENLLLGTLGNLFIALAFSAALLSAISYYFAFRETEKGIFDWKKLGRNAFRAHTLGVLGIIGTLFYILINHHFEYHYAYQHTSSDLPFKYVFAAFWEGQEGSFMLWAFWHVVIGNILIRTSKTMEAPVMVVMALVQFFLVSMVLGIVVEIPGLMEHKFGSNPFLLTREHPNMMGMPFTKIATYLNTLDGRGLNPSLQNYWMTIHPPTLFLGFALTVVPYAYAVAGIWKRDLNGWMKPGLPWAFAGVMVLGGGILMGGAWAYEALNFGGFWAWDPVENSSLVPWLVLVGGAHLMLIHKNKGTNLMVSVLLNILSFILVLYSTFLTRSGILGDASVHSFTDLGMSEQLLAYLFFFIWFPMLIAMKNLSWRINLVIVSAAVVVIGLWLGIMGWILVLFVPVAIGSVYGLRKVDARHFDKKEEDHVYSREFWMFVGALVLLGSAAHLAFVTSLPVLNKITGTKYAPLDIDGYNSVQIFFAIVITLLIGAGQFFRYRKTDPKMFFRSVSRALIASLALTLAAGILFEDFRDARYIVMAFGAGFAVLANMDYIVQFVKGKWKLAGPSIAHIGFGLIMLGAVISAGHKKFISQNTSLINLESLNEEFKNNENVMLHRDEMVQMGEYYLRYKGDTVLGNKAYYHVDYYKRSKDGEIVKAFDLEPRLLINERMGNVPEPATKHYLDRDIFTHVTYVDIEKVKRRMGGNTAPEFSEPQHVTIGKNDTIYLTNYYVVFDGFEAMSSIENLDKDQNLNIKLRGLFYVKTFNGELDTIHPIYEVRDNFLYTEPGYSERAGLELVVEKIIDDKNVEISFTEKKQNPINDFIIMQAIIFPGINILWAGCFLMVLGTALAVLKRIFGS